MNSVFLFNKYIFFIFGCWFLPEKFSFCLKNTELPESGGGGAAAPQPRGPYAYGRYCVCSSGPWAHAVDAGQTLLVQHSLDGSAHFCLKWRHGRHLESMMSYQKSYVYLRDEQSCHFIPIWFEMTDLRLFWRGSPNNDKMGYGITSWSKNWSIFRKDMEKGTLHPSWLTAYICY